MLVIYVLLQYIDEPLCAFIRLAKGIVLPHTMEVPLPVRFVFLLLTPQSEESMINIDPHEVGRSFSTMMSNPVIKITRMIFIITSFEACFINKIIEAALSMTHTNMFYY